MPYIAVDKDGACAIYEEKPIRQEEDWNPITYPSRKTSYWMYIPESAMLRLTGKVLTWEDEPFELTD